MKLSLPCTTFGQFIGYYLIFFILHIFVLHLQQKVQVSEDVKYITQIVFNSISGLILISFLITLFTDSCMGDINQINPYLAGIATLIFVLGAISSFSGCKSLLWWYGIQNRGDFRRWAHKGHPDKGGDQSTFQEIANCMDEMKKN